MALHSPSTQVLKLRSGIHLGAFQDVPQMALASPWQAELAATFVPAYLCLLAHAAKYVGESAGFHWPDTEATVRPLRLVYGNSSRGLASSPPIHDGSPLYRKIPACEALFPRFPLRLTARKGRLLHALPMRLPYCNLSTCLFHSTCRCCALQKQAVRHVAREGAVLGDVSITTS